MTEFLLEHTLFLTLLLGIYVIFHRKDKRFLFNRIFVVGMGWVALALPFVRMPAWASDVIPDTSHLQGSLEMVMTNSANITPTTEPSYGSSATEGWSVLLWIYLLGATIMLGRFVLHLVKLQMARRQGKRLQRDGYHLLLTDQVSSPFCYGRTIHVNAQAYHTGNIDNGVLLHERVHACQFHTLDILLMEVLLIIGWFHPLLWINRYLIKEHHEFACDHYVLKSGYPRTSYSHLLLDQSHQSHSLALISNFSYSLIKNRIAMMKTDKKSAPQFLGRISLSLTAMLLLLVACSAEEHLEPAVASSSSDFVVVVDAGHGGIDDGAIDEPSGISEKSIVLGISNALESLETPNGVRLIFTRNADRGMDLSARSAIAKENDASLLLSLHIDLHPNVQKNEVGIYSSELNKFPKISHTYASQFAQELDLNSVNPPVLKSADHFILKHPPCPSVLLSLGNLANNENREFLVKEENQQLLASQIMTTIEALSRYN